METSKQLRSKTQNHCAESKTYLIQNNNMFLGSQPKTDNNSLICSKYYLGHYH